MTLVSLAGLVAGLAWWGAKRGPVWKASDRRAGETSTPRFEVRVAKPRIARPIFGILPTLIENRLPGLRELRFDEQSPGATIGSVGENRLELRAEGWDLLIETDSEGRLQPETRLIFAFDPGENPRRLRCQPGDQPAGYLKIDGRRATGPAEAPEYRLDGSFAAEVGGCLNVETQKSIGWPAAPLTVSGRFSGLPASVGRYTDNPDKPPAAPSRR